MEEYNILDKFFNYREEKFLEQFTMDTDNLKSMLKDINKEQITKLIDNIPQENTALKQELTASIDNLVADYNIILAYYNKKYYKQGFEDGSGIMRISAK